MGACLCVSLCLSVCICFFGYTYEDILFVFECITTYAQNHCKAFLFSLLIY